MTNLSDQLSTPRRPIVVYDGQCAFCIRQVTKMKQRDRNDTFDYLPNQTEGLELEFPKLMEQDLNAGMRLINTDSTVSVGADAVYQITRRLDGWRHLAWLYRVPILRWVFRATYAWVAKNRHRLAEQCTDGRCEL